MRDKDLRYVCLECNEEEIVSRRDHKIDGRSCKHCGGHLCPTGYVIGIDLAKGNDFSVVDGKVIENLSR